MLDKYIILTFVIKFGFTQISSELWLLKHKLTEVVDAPTPSLEDVVKFDTDVTDKIVLKDIDVLTDRKPVTNAVTIKQKNLKKTENLMKEIHFKIENKMKWHMDNDTTFIIDDSTSQTTRNGKDQKELKQINDDTFKFLFRGDYDIVTTSANKVYVLTPIKKKPNEKVANNFDTVEYLSVINNPPNSEKICTNMKRTECYRKHGLVYKEIERTVATICCVLPMTKEQSSKIIFPDTFMNKNKRYRRSPEEIIRPGLIQRNFLLKRKYDTITSTLREIKPKIVSSEEDYIDPYWNIKSSNMKHPNPQRNPTKSNNDCYQDYVADYISEVPKPGLLGVYSNPGGFSYGGNIEDYDYNDDSPGYSTIDPRRGSASSTPPPRKPSKPLIGLEEVSYNPETQTISYQSSPDFQVLQGFKLLNLARNKNKFYSKNTRKTMAAESVIEKNSEEFIPTKSSSEINFLDKQVFKACGTTTQIPLSNGKLIGSAENGSHPWLALIVESKRPSTILCYATIVHPRAAMSSADCVNRAANGEITLIAGLWDLKDRSQSQSRLASVLLHPQYKSNNLAHNLAVLYWTRPLRLGTNIQPACIGEPKADEDCMLFGWSGYDQAIRPRSRWQSASMLSPRQCNARLSSNKRGPSMPTDGFCAAVPSRGTVTGIGAPLICERAGRATATGVAVWRDTVVVFMPADEWPRTAVLELLDD